jgi:hypothetical protein
MDRLGAAAILCVALASWSVGASAQSDDEAWIERAMADRPLAPSGATRGAGLGDQVSVADLPRFVGYAVRLELNNGRSRLGVLVAADAQRVTLQSAMGGGKADYAIVTSSIVSATLE